MPGPSVVTFGFDVLDRVEQAAANVKERLKRSVAALDAAGIPHAVVGGHAVAAWVARIDPAAVRTTVDVNLLIDRADLPRAIVALEKVGFIHSFTFGINIFVDGPNGKAREAVHILDMIDVGLIEAGTVARLPAELRPRLEELLATPGG